MFVTINGQIVDVAANGLSPLDRGFLLGDGIFETLRVYAGEPFKLREHLTRLADGCNRTAIDFFPDMEALLVSEIERANASGMVDSFVRITLSRGAGFGLGTTPERATLVTIIDSLPELNPTWYSRGIRVVTATGRRNEFSVSSGLKTTAYLDSILAFRASTNNGAEDAVFLDTSGHLSEATASNLFLVDGETLYTPPLGCGALPGITRATVIGIAKAQGMRVVLDQCLDPGRLRSASEAFLTSSIREIVPVISFDGLAIAGGAPGTITRQTITAYSEATRCRF